MTGQEAEGGSGSGGQCLSSAHSEELWGSAPDG